MTATALMTAAEFLALPERTDARRCELIDGERVVNEPTWTHNRAQMVIGAALETWTRAAAGRGRAGLPLDVQFDDDNVHCPDIVWYREGRAPARGHPRPYRIPDIAVEVRSPSTWRFDIGRKKDNYELHGVAELWLVDTAADVVLVFRRASPKSARFDLSLELGPGEHLTSLFLPGFSLSVSEIFEG